MAGWQMGEDSNVNIADRIEAGFDRAIADARKRSSWFDHAWEAKLRLDDVLSGRLAAAISYYGFFAAFALVVVIYSILGRALGAGGNQLTEQGGLLGTINTYLSNNLPWIIATARQVGRGEVTLVGLLALVFAGVGWVEALRSSQRAVWLLDEDPGHWIIRRLVDLGMLVGLGLLLGLSLAMTAAIDSVLNFLAPNTNFGNWLVRSSGPVLEFGVNLILAAAILGALPRLRMSPRRLIPVTLVVGVGIQLLNSIGKWYIARTEERPAYQLVAGAVGLLIYLYLLNQLILIGAALAATSTRGTVRDLAAGPDPAATERRARLAEAAARWESGASGGRSVAHGNLDGDVGEAHTGRSPKPR
jgi:membrane protein